jgi:25S rRNA (adenine2142-N1)-methyltransferase
MGSTKQSLKSLRAGRPPLAKSSKSMSRKASRKLINTHHQLEKRRRQAASEGDEAKERSLSMDIAKLGGLEHYQKASLQGQSSDRGGDTSKVLLSWLPISELKGINRRLKMLEIGALSIHNACSTSEIFEVVHIDLNSQEPGIVQQDFMERPLPKDESEKFDIISLSLVLNFVPDAAGRGQMLARTLSFLHKRLPEPSSATAEMWFPSLFLVLPRSCVDNSRYFTEGRLEALMKALGYSKIVGKHTQKLTYSLWRRTNTERMMNAQFPKKELNPGRTRNNFVITLDENKGRAQGK